MSRALITRNLGIGLAAALFAVAAFLVLAVQSAAGSEVDQRAEIVLMPTGVIAGATGEAELRLRIVEAAAVEEEAEAEEVEEAEVEEAEEPEAEEAVEAEEAEIDFRIGIEAEGLTPGATFSLFIDGMLIASDEADDQGRLRLDEDPEVTLTDLAGVMVSIKDSAGMVVLHGTVM